MTYGGTLFKPAVVKSLDVQSLSQAAKWNSFFLNEKGSASYNTFKETTASQVLSNAEKCKELIVDPQQPLSIKDFFTTKRRLATGANDYFILDEQQLSRYHIPEEFVVPVLPNPRFLKQEVILGDENRYPLVPCKLFLLHCSLPEYEIKRHYPGLWNYLQIGLDKGINEGYLCKSRKIWYQQEERPDCQFIFSYMGRASSVKTSPFRFLLNYSNATVTNAYHILYPRPFLKELLASDTKLIGLVFQALKNISSESLVSEGRTYGGGLFKLEPKELENTSAATLQNALSQYFQAKYERE